MYIVLGLTLLLLKRPFKSQAHGVHIDLQHVLCHKSQNLNNSELLCHASSGHKNKFLGTAFV